ncbi:MAG: AraC family transcriptional regulator [Clostridiales bacterium]|nr:AraC family transcriptional regulator [Clostridiales bacterium]
MIAGVTFRYRLENTINISKILTADYKHVTEDYCFAAERHNFWELFYADTGKIQLNLDGHDVELNEGELILFPPNLSHAVSITKNSNSTYFLITFDCFSPSMSFFKDAKFKLTAENKKILSNILDEVTHTFQFNMEKKRLELIENYTFGGQQLIHSYLEILLISILRYEDETKKKQKIYLKKEDVENQTVKDIIALLQDAVYDNVTLDEISQQLRYGKTYLSGLFKANVHCSIMQYYISLKLTEAKKLLKNTFMPITEISEKLHYDSPSYFCKIFKKHYGISPKQYRQSISSDS